MSRLPLLRHLEIGQHADDFLLLNLAVRFPQITSFVHSETPGFDPGQFRAIIVAFPALQRLMIYRMQPVSTRKKSENWDYLEHQTLVWLSVADLYPAVQPRVKFPKVRTVFGSLYERSFNLQQALKAFPILQSLRVRSMGGEPIYLCAKDPEEANIQSIWSRNVRLRVSLAVLSRFLRQSLICLFRSDLRWTGRRLQPGGHCSSQSNPRTHPIQPSGTMLEGTQPAFCPMLELEGVRERVHFLRADDTCHGLEKVHIIVEGVPRLTDEQERLLDPMKQLDRSEPETADEISALEQQQLSYAT
ncbi:hypothetical protein BGX29_004013 [Mortierella sp. GBA35]|nr:hypothetical protein BGX29_004013 [Mortierella sp. GBA35]